MKQSKNRMQVKDLKYCSSNTFGIFKMAMLSFIFICIISCESFLEIDPPKDKLVNETLFQDVALVEGALANIYYKMREQGMVSGTSGLSTSMGVYTDELKYIGDSDDRLRLENHTVTALHPTMSDWWSNAYNLIYAANDIIKGVENSNNLSIEEKETFKGQALFVRAYLHSLLVGLFGDVPYVSTPNYLENNVATRTPKNEVYNNIIRDLNLATPLLEDVSEERVVPNKSAAQALLARMYLYVENWAMAEITATSVIDAHVLEPDVSKVFLKESQETLWQFKPGASIRNTLEAIALIIQAVPTTTGYPLADNLLVAFEPNDLRRANWVGSKSSANGLETLYFAYKYKEPLVNIRQPILEYSIIFRLAEQYLIRAEARAHLDKIGEAQEDLNAIRNRAGLGNTTASNTNELLDAILQERQVELFTEHGQRWFDLKRLGNPAEVLAPIKPGWRNTDILLPIPETELLANPNLKPQNDGY
tara:strand:- start:2264 stop:3694 length:1431 start_codon:yes stop_codon:yes gene_type:complete